MPIRRNGSRAARLGAAIALPIASAALLAACSSAVTPAATPSASATQNSAPVGTPGPVATASPATAAPTSCSVVTQAEAGAALGQAVKPPLLGKATVEGGVACVFYGPEVPPGTSPDIAVGDSVRVVLVTGPDAKKWFDDYRGKVHAQAISGLGDEAYYDGYASISVLQGDAYVRIAVGIANNLSAEETLARDALPRM
jgi:hypothetical protein